MRKQNLRSFDEIWEKYFEIGGLFMETEAFMAQMNAYCSLLRSHTPQEELKEDGCLLREQYMAEQIARPAGSTERFWWLREAFT